MDRPNFQKRSTTLEENPITTIVCFRWMGKTSFYSPAILFSLIGSVIQRQLYIVFQALHFREARIFCCSFRSLHSSNFASPGYGSRCNNMNYDLYFGSGFFPVDFPLLDHLFQRGRDSFYRNPFPFGSLFPWEPQKLLRRGLLA